MNIKSQNGAKHLYIGRVFDCSAIPLQHDRMALRWDVGDSSDWNHGWYKALDVNIGPHSEAQCMKDRLSMAVEKHEF